MARLAAALAALFVVVSALAARPHGQDLVVSSSTGVLPAAEEAARAVSHSGQPVSVMAGGSLLGLTLAAKGDVGLALTEVRPTPPLHALLLARLPVAVVAHAGTAVTGLTSDEVRAVLAGAISNWSQLGGRPLPLTVFFRTPVSGVRMALLGLLFGRADVTARSVNALSNGDVLMGVGRTVGAIGFVERLTRPPGVDVLAVDGVLPGEPGYPLAIPVYAAWLGTLTHLEREYLGTVAGLLR